MTTQPLRNDSQPPVALPVFAAPPEPTDLGPRSQPEPGSPGPEAEQLATSRPSLANRLGLGNRKPDGEDSTPSGTSSPERGGKKLASAGEAAALFAGALLAVAAAAAWVVQARTGGRATFRVPTEAQRDQIAAPLGRIASRHISADLLNADLADVVKTAGAVGAYITAAPIIQPTKNTEEPTA